MKEPEKNFDKAIEFAEKKKEEALNKATNKAEKEYLEKAFDQEIQELKERKKKLVDGRELTEKKKIEEIEKRKQKKGKN
jgi:vacuolar-type H+-ATPase subunit H